MSHGFSTAFCVKSLYNICNITHGLNCKDILDSSKPNSFFNYPSCELTHSPILVAEVSLECDFTEVPEDMGPLEVCAVLTSGELAINITVNLSTICGEACG